MRLNYQLIIIIIKVCTQCGKAAAWENTYGHPQIKLRAIFSHRDHDNHCAFERLSLSLSRKSKTQTGLWCGECVRQRAAIWN